MRTTRLLTLLTLVGALPSSSCAPAPTPAPEQTAAPARSAPHAAGALARARTAGEDTLPRVHFADRGAQPLPGADASAAGAAALPQVAAALGLAPADLQGLEAFAHIDLPGGGALLRHRARLGGREVFDSGLNIVLDGDHRLVGWTVGGAWAQALRGGPKQPPALSAGQAVAAAVHDRLGLSVPAPGFGPGPAEVGDWGWLRPAPATDLVWEAPPRARELLVAGPDGLRVVWEVELAAVATQTPDTGWWRLQIDAQDGNVLRREALTAHATYRVWADSTGDLRPRDNPWEDYSPHPTSAPDGGYPTNTAPVLVSLDGFNDPGTGLADPWLPSGATETLGNNARAYTDRDGTDGLSGSDTPASVSSPDTFDWTYDLAAEPAVDEAQRAAPIVQAFYTVNWLHDWFYDSGFNEANGVAQADNYGRGGEAADAMKVELQDNADAGSRNNANMSTPADGSEPRMQVYLWTGRSESAVTAAAAGGDLSHTNGSFGATNFDLSGELALPGGDGKACSAVPGDVGGKVALVNRGDCTFVVKAQNAQDAGAIAVLIANNVSGSAPSIGSSTGSASVTIPVLGLTQTDGATLGAAVLAGERPEVSLTRSGTALIDGGLDNSVIAHEWGHYLFGRLSSCGTTQCGGINEGWADFLSLWMMLREGDDLSGSYGPGGWANQSDSTDPAYYGIRRVPYSVDPANNALSFKHIQRGEALPTSHPVSGGGDNAEVHNTGEIWATAAFEAYVALHEQALLDGVPFADVQRRMSDILVAGLALTPSDFTFTELRDALLMAAVAIDPADADVMAQAFAVRGMGSCAVSPPRTAGDNVGVVEDFSLRPMLGVELVGVDDLDLSCDGDGLLDANENGALVVRLHNTGAATLSAPTVSITADPPVPGLEGLELLPLVASPLAPWSSAELRIPLHLDRLTGVPSTTTFTVEVTDASACVTSVTDSLFVALEQDATAAASATDGFAVDDGTWTLTGDEASRVWGRVVTATGEASWLGQGVTGITDTQLVSPPLLVSATDPLRFTFTHRWSFETSSGILWDGGVLELRVDGGDWVDISTWVDPGYTGALTDQAGNPLSLRPAFSATNSLWPAYEDLSLDLGTALAGSTVELRLRVGTDPGVSDVGWEIDQIAIEGITNTPFPAWSPDADACNPPPIAEAGPDQAVEPDAEVRLDGSASADPDGDPITYAWAQVSGPTVTLDDPTGVGPGFVAPRLDESAALVFQLTVTDDAQSAVDEVEIEVNAYVPDPVDDTGEDDGADGDPVEPGDGDDGGDATDDGSADGGSPTDTGGAAAEGGGAKDDGGGCGCASGPRQGLGALGLLSGLLGLLWRRRR